MRLMPLVLVLSSACSPGTDTSSTTSSSSSSSSGGASSASMGSSSSSSSMGGTSLYGFTIRTPQEHEVPCDGMFCSGSSITVQDQDHLCTLSYANRTEYIYVQSHPVAAQGVGGLQFAVDGAWHSDGTTARAITGLYEWGGNHHNDAITVDVDSFRFKYNHSTYGFGFRACQPPDCLEVYALPGATVVENGCDPERTLAETCVLIELDGTVPSLTREFMRCPGDTP